MSKCLNGSWSKWACVCPARWKFSKVCRQVTPWSQPVTSVCKKTVPWFGWWTCLNPVVVDLLAVRPVQVRRVQVQVLRVRRLPVLPPRVQVQVQVQVQRDRAQVLLASPVKAPPRAPKWRDRTLA